MNFFVPSICACSPSAALPLLKIFQPKTLTLRARSLLARYSEAILKGAQSETLPRRCGRSILAASRGGTQDDLEYGDQGTNRRDG
jgi:hypothetical protein